MTWTDITVQQFQDIYRLRTDSAIGDDDRVERVVSIMYNLTDKQIGELSVNDFNAKAKACAFLLNSPSIPGKPVRRIRVGTRLYKMEYNPSKLVHRQYVEIMHWGTQPIENMHFIMASLVRPVKWGFVRKNKATEHEAIAADMLNAPLCHVYHATVFFWKLLKNSMDSLKGFLEKELIAKKMTSKEVQVIVNTLYSSTGGYIQLIK